MWRQCLCLFLETALRRYQPSLDGQAGEAAMELEVRDVLHAWTLLCFRFQLRAGLVIENIFPRRPKIPPVVTSFLWDNEFKVNFLVHCRPYIFFIKAVAFNNLSPTILSWILVSMIVFLVCLLVFVLKDSVLNWVSLKLLVFLAQEDLEIYLTSNHVT